MIIGIDEVGRGAMAGPLVVGAVALEIDPQFYLNDQGDERIFPLPQYDWIQDSKKISKEERPEIARKIEQVAIAWSIGISSPSEIDEFGLTIATGMAITSALKEMPEYDQLVIDGNTDFLPGNHKAKYVINADNFVPQVSAASIIAKVFRDDLMVRYARLYPAYGFDEHVGYGTQQHLDAIKQHDACPIHRMSFGRLKLLAKPNEA